MMARSQRQVPRAPARHLAWVGAAALLLAAPWAFGARQTEEEHVLSSETPYQQVAGTIDAGEIKGTINDLAAMGSRVTGYPGYEQAATYVERRFKELGLEPIDPQKGYVETYPLVIPVVKPDAEGRAATVSIVRDGAMVEEFGIEPMWPNLVRLCKTPRNGISGRLIYAHKGSLREFNGLDVTGSIVLLDHNCGSDWYNGPLLGARAVLFIEPEATIRGEAEQKFMSMPVDLPRFWVPKEVADHLLGLLESQDRVTVRLDCDMVWEKKPDCKNIVGRITGSDPALAKETVVINAYYDSISVVPTLSPGAENACSLASMFQIIKAFKAYPPKRTVIFLATSGHFEAMAGTKYFIRNRVRGARQDKRVRRMFELVDGSRRTIQEATDRVWEEEPEPDYESVKREQEERKTPDQIATERVKALGRLDKALKHAKRNLWKLERTIARAEKEKDPNEGIQPERQLNEEEMKDRLEYIELFRGMRQKAESAVADAREEIAGARKDGSRRDATLSQKREALDRAKKAIESVTDELDLSSENTQLWVSIDLSSHNETFGVFYKGYFYNYSEAIQWKFSDIGKKSREYGDLIGEALGIDPTTRLVDGINAIQGKSWSVYMAGKLSLSSEVATLAGIPGIAFATVDDSRPQIDTPLDLPEYVNTEAIARQTEFLACLLCDLISISKPEKFYDLRLDDNFVEIKGRVVRFKPEVSTFPDDPVESAVAVARTPYNQKTSMGVRAEIFDISTPIEYTKEEQEAREAGSRKLERDIFREGGRIHMLGLPNVRACGGQISVNCYKLDDEDGRVTMAPDMGVNG
ncbi:MAG: M28 family peptidase, partial [Armatimonadetes bacterium]|nr:M28 family peptidase [Armatimonadota bacterium]